MNTTASQCSIAGNGAEISIQRIESMAHTWLARFGLGKVTQGMKMTKHREAGLRTAGLSEVFVPSRGNTWLSARQFVVSYLAEICTIDAHADVGRLVESILEPGTTGNNLRVDPVTIATQLGRIASVLAWNGLEACKADTHIHEPKLPAEFGRQHATWVMIHDA